MKAPGPHLSIGEAIRMLRTSSGLSQKNLAEAVSVDPTYISHLEADRREPSLSLLRAIARALDVPPGLILAVAFWTDLPKEDRDRYSSLVRSLVDAAGAAQFVLFDRGRDPDHSQ